MRTNSNEKVYPHPYYPVGSIYLSTNDTNPSKWFGGEWELIAQGMTLVGVNPNDNDFSTPKKTGGEKTHKLTEAEMPSHNHDIIKNVPYGIPYNNTSGVHATNSGATMYGESYSPFSIGYRGGNQPHNNMPPYFTCYIWNRIA